LGRLFAQAIAQQLKGPVLVLTGRSRLALDQEAFLEKLRKLGARVDYRSVDVGQRAAMRDLVQKIVAQYGRLNGVIHAAGVLNDRLLANKGTEEFEQVFRPKVAGLVALDEATEDIALDWMVLCSSVAGIWGNVGQLDYAAANGFMDRYAQSRQGLVTRGLRRGRTVSVSWPLWAEGGMRMDGAAQAWTRSVSGLEALPTKEGLAALSRALLQPASHVVVLYGQRTRLLAHLRTASQSSVGKAHPVQ